MSDLPTGTITFLFTDVEGSTRLLQEARESYPALQDAHADIVRRSIADAGGTVVRTEGDSFFAVFTSPLNAVRAAIDSQRGLAGHRWPAGRRFRVRMGLHTGEGISGRDDYVGIDVNRASRIAAAAWGGQVLLSEATATLVAGAPTEEALLRSLGFHDLKDFDRPEKLYELVIKGLEEQFPPPNTRGVPSNLPPELTSFVGRVDEVHRIEKFLTRSRLVTITGPGGTGKTRVALRVAKDVASEFDGGTFLVDLSPVSDPDLIVPTIAAVLGIREEGWERPVAEALHEYLRDRRILLVLDNFEQLLGASPIVTDLLQSAPELKIVVTSRAPLRVSGEQDAPLHPLPVPQRDSIELTDELEMNDAVTLFVQRARAVAPDFDLGPHNAPEIAELVSRLDGLPLAIELAASRAAVLGPAALLERIERRLPLLTGGPRDAPARQQTLRAAIAWSYELLTESERRLFRGLAIMSGGATLQAIEAICGGYGEVGIDALDGVSRLVEHSLVHRVEASGHDARFGMLQTIREFALERLEAEDEAGALQRRHADWFLRLAETAEPFFRGPELELWLDVIYIEHDNLRAVLRWAIERDEGEIGLRMVHAMWRFWHLGGYLSEGRVWARAVLSLPSASMPTVARARALAAAGGLAYWQHDTAAVRAAYEEALEISRRLGDDRGVAEGTYNLAFATGLARGRREAEKLFGASLELFDALGEKRGYADALAFLADCVRERGDPAWAREQAERSLQIHREIGDLFGQLDSLHSLGRSALDLGDLELARACFIESLEVFAPFGYRTLVAIVLDNLAAEALRRGRPARAVRLAGASEALKEAAGGRAPPEFMDLPDPREVARPALSREQIDRAWQEGRLMTFDDAVAYARLEE